MEFFRINDNGVTNVTILFVDNDTPFKEYFIENRWKSFISYAIINNRPYYFKFGMSIFRQLITWCGGEGNITNNTTAISFEVTKGGRYGRPTYTVNNIRAINESIPIRSVIDNIKTRETPISEIISTFFSNNNIKPRKKSIIYDGKGFKHKFVY